MRPLGVSCYPWAQPWDRRKLKVDLVCTQYQNVQRSDNICSTSKSCIFNHWKLNLIKFIPVECILPTKVFKSIKKYIKTLIFNGESI